MKKVLSIVLSVAMLMTVACSMFVMPASAAEPATPISFLAESYIAEGAENVTVNEDGSFTATGAFALAPRITFDYTVYKYVEIVIETDIDISVSFLDRDPRSEDEDTTNDAESYGEHWINFESEWFAKNGGYLAPTDGLISYTGTQGGLYSIYNWCTTHSPFWTNDGTATARALYITPATEGVAYTVRALGVTDGSTNKDFGAAEFEYNTEADLAVKDAAAWSLTAAAGSNPAVEVVDNTLVFSNDGGMWPSAYINYAEPYVVDATAMVYVDFTVAYDAATTIYLYCGDANAETYASDMSNVITIHMADMGPGNYKGYITLADIAPAAGESSVLNADGDLVINAIRVFSTTAGGVNTALNPTVTVRDIKLCYTVEEPTPDIVPGDLNGTGAIDMRDALKIFQAASGKATLTDAEIEIADYDGNGTVNMRDALAVFQVASGR